MQRPSPVVPTQQDHGTYLDIVKAPQPWVPWVPCPGSSDDSGKTRRRLDTFSSPEDEQARSAVLRRFPCEQYHKGITKCINNLWEESNSLPRCRCLQQWNRTSAPLLQACARSKEIWSQPQAFQVPQDLRTSLVKTMAPQPQDLSGPMAQGPLMTTETHDEDLILSPAPKMNNHEVPSYFDSLPLG